jgi:hypothetical protein
MFPHTDSEKFLTMVRDEMYQAEVKSKITGVPVDIILKKELDASANRVAALLSGK